MISLSSWSPTWEPLISCLIFLIIVTCIRHTYFVFVFCRFVIQVYPKSNRGDLDDIGEMDGEESIPPTSIETLEATGQKEPSPFSSKKVVHKSDTPHGTSNQSAEGTSSSYLLF
jgi:hypothetical protein